MNDKPSVPFSAPVALVEACRGLVHYWTRNLRNFQWEKADTHVKRINIALGDLSSAAPAAPVTSELADRIEKIIDPEFCNYGPSHDGVPRVIGNLKASEWRQVINALRGRGVSASGRKAALQEAYDLCESVRQTTMLYDDNAQGYRQGALDCRTAIWNLISAADRQAESG